MTPHKTLLNHKPPSLASLGNSANSAKGFSSRMRINSDGWGSVWPPRAGGGGGGAVGEGKEMEGVMFRKVLKATWEMMTSARHSGGGLVVVGVEIRSSEKDHG